MSFRAQLASSRKRAEALAGELTGTANPLPELEEEQDEEEPDAVPEEPTAGLREPAASRLKLSCNSRARRGTE